MLLNSLYRADLLIERASSQIGLAQRPTEVLTVLFFFFHCRKSDAGSQHWHSSSGPRRRRRRCATCCPRGTPLTRIARCTRRWKTGQVGRGGDGSSGRWVGRVKSCARPRSSSTTSMTTSTANASRAVAWKLGAAPSMQAALSLPLVLPHGLSDSSFRLVLLALNFGLFCLVLWEGGVGGGWGVGVGVGALALFYSVLFCSFAWISSESSHVNCSF